jgi:Mitochondrial branched-chain alpha-ketoacid dehydrogenase kinase
MQQRHSTVVETMARGVIEMKDQAAATIAGTGSEPEIFVIHDIENRTQYFLDRFYMMRISIRLLIHQHRT